MDPWDAMYNRLFSATKKRKKKINVKITKEEFINISIQNCFYCGAKPAIEPRWHKNRNIKRNTIDRIDSQKDYEIENCVAACFQCNFAKMDYDIEEFKKHILNIYNFMKDKNE